MQLPDNKTGYTFSIKRTDAVTPVNSTNFSVTKFADTEAEALALLIDDVQEYLSYLENRQTKVGKAVVSPFAAIKK